MSYRWREAITCLRQRRVAWGCAAIVEHSGWTTLPGDTDEDFFVDYLCPPEASEVRAFSRAPLRLALWVVGKPLLMLDAGTARGMRRYRVVVGASALRRAFDHRLGAALLSSLVELRWSRTSSTPR